MAAAAAFSQHLDPVNSPGGIVFLAWEPQVNVQFVENVVTVTLRNEADKPSREGYKKKERPANP